MTASLWSGLLFASTASAQVAPQPTTQMATRVALHQFDRSSASAASSRQNQSFGWHFTLAAYAISPTLGGKIGVGNAFPTATVDYAATEVFAHPQIGGVLYAQVSDGWWSLAIEGLYLDRSQPILGGILFHRHRLYASRTNGRDMWRGPGFVACDWIGQCPSPRHRGLPLSARRDPIRARGGWRWFSRAK